MHMLSVVGGLLFILIIDIGDTYAVWTCANGNLTGLYPGLNARKMASIHTSESTVGKVRFQSMPNFREVDEETTEKTKDDNTCKLYRSSRPDFLSEAEADQFKSLGIRTIIDFRSAREYRKANGSKVLDEAFPVYKVKLPFFLRYKPSDTIKYKRLKLNKPSDSLPEDTGRRHVLIDFFKMNYIWAVFTRAPWYIQLYSMFHLIVDVLFDTGFKHFVRLFARNVLNHVGLAGQYIDMINYSQAPICAGMILYHYVHMGKLIRQ